MKLISKHAKDARKIEEETSRRQNEIFKMLIQQLQAIQTNQALSSSLVVEPHLLPLVPGEPKKGSNQNLEDPMNNTTIFN